MVQLPRATLRIFSLLSIYILIACSVAKLEARLEANPQCKEVINPKTGALMPCPGSEKAFYRSAGLESSQKQTVDRESIANNASPTAKTITPSSTYVSPPPQPTTPNITECKPKIHQKTGGTLPCPTQD